MRQAIGYAACECMLVMRRRALRRLALALPVIGVVIVGTPASITVGANGPIHCGIEMRNLLLHVADGVVLQVTALDGEFVSRSATAPPIFDDPNSYTLRIKSADMHLDGPSLTKLFELSAKAHPSPLSDVKITIEGGLMKAEGKLKKGVTVPFSMTASVAATPDGMLRLHATKLKTVGVPVKGLFDLLGLKVDDVMKMPPGSGLRAENDDLLMDAAAMLPPPRTEGKLQQADISGSRLHLKMTGPGAPPAHPATRPLPSAKNYLYFYGGSIRFGKLTMSDTDMQLIDADPRDPFDFSPPHYEEQLVAGYSRNTRRKGLQVFMPDYAKVSAKRGQLPAPKLGT
jgi:hypothetical protein